MLNQEENVNNLTSEETAKEMLENIFNLMKEVYDYFKIETIKGKDGSYYADYDVVNHKINELYSHNYANAKLADALYHMNKINQIIDTDILFPLYDAFMSKYRIFTELTK